MVKTLLLVDDDARILDTAQDILEAAGFAVRTAETGAAALQHLQDQGSDVMIVDLNLLDIRGTDLAVKVRQICPDIQVVLMTGEAGVDLGPAKDIIRATLTKPVNPANLIDLLQQIS